MNPSILQVISAFWILLTYFVHFWEARSGLSCLELLELSFVYHASVFGRLLRDVARVHTDTRWFDAGFGVEVIIGCHHKWWLWSWGLVLIAAVVFVGKLSSQFVCSLETFILWLRHFLVTGPFHFLPSGNLSLLLLLKQLWIVVQARRTSDFLVLAVIYELAVILGDFGPTRPPQPHRQRASILIIWSLKSMRPWQRLRHLLHNLRVVQGYTFRWILFSRIL